MLIDLLGVQFRTIIVTNAIANKIQKKKTFNESHVLLRVVREKSSLSPA